MYSFLTPYIEFSCSPHADEVFTRLPTPHKRLSGSHLVRGLVVAQVQEQKIKKKKQLIKRQLITEKNNI